MRGEWTLYHGQQGTSKWKHGGKDPDVQEALSQWFSVVTRRGVHVSGPV
jgi:hypothetical protein